MLSLHFVWGILTWWPFHMFCKARTWNISIYGTARSTWRRLVEESSHLSVMTIFWGNDSSVIHLFFNIIGLSHHTCNWWGSTWSCLSRRNCTSPWKRKVTWLHPDVVYLIENLSDNLLCLWNGRCWHVKWPKKNQVEHCKDANEVWYRFLHSQLCNILLMLKF